MLVPKIQRPKIFEMEKNDQLITTTATTKKNNNNKKKKQRQPKGMKDVTCVCIFDESVGKCSQYTMREGVAYRCQSHA